MNNKTKQNKNCKEEHSQVFQFENINANESNLQLKIQMHLPIMSWNICKQVATFDSFVISIASIRSNRMDFTLIHRQFTFQSQVWFISMRRSDVVLSELVFIIQFYKNCSITWRQTVGFLSSWDLFFFPFVLFCVFRCCWLLLLLLLLLISN